MFKSYLKSLVSFAEQRNFFFFNQLRFSSCCDVKVNPAGCGQSLMKGRQDCPAMNRSVINLPGCLFK